MDTLMNKFNEDMKNIYFTAKKELGYNATRFINLVAQKGGFMAAKQLISKDGGTYGFEVLWENKRLDLSVEALVLNPEYISLFTNEERTICLNRLKEFGYIIGQGIKGSDPASVAGNQPGDFRTTILEKVKDTFKDCEVGSVFSREEIIEMVVKKHNCNKGSVIPSDYCYNRINGGIDFENTLHIFEYLDSGMYKYLGEKNPYTGIIYHKPKGGSERPVGKWVNGVISYDTCYYEQPNIKITNKETPQAIKSHRTKREIGDKLRYTVMKRDNFKCCNCGTSPAKDPSIELHVDHIIPWSRGGETVLENLQTLCSKCNIGKSDSI